MQVVEVQSFDEVYKTLKTEGIIKNLRELAEAIGYNYSYLSSLKTNDSIFRAELITNINDRFGTKFLYIKNPKALPQITSDENGKSIPFYDTEVFATISPAMSDTVAMKPQTFITIPIFNQGEFAVQVTGHSMKGYINHGDWIVVKKITEVQDLIYGEPYLIITKADNIKTVKFIRKGSSEEYFNLTPYNTVQFEPQELRKEAVLEIYKVIGLFRNM